MRTTLSTPAADGGGVNLSAGASARASRCPVGGEETGENDGDLGVTVPAPVEPVWRRWPRVAYECTAMLLGYAYYGGLGLLVNAVCWPLSFLLAGRPGAAHGCQRMIRWLFAFFVAYLDAAGIVRVEFADGVEKSLRALRGAIIAPNHPCLLDAVFLISRLPRVTCIMKRAVLRNPVMGGTARLAGYLCNDSGPNFIRRCRDALRRGDCLLIFPEGTRTRLENRPVNPFKKGFALIATLANAPVQTVFIETPTHYLGKRWPMLQKPTLPVRFRITLGRRFDPVPGTDAKTLGDELERYFRAHLEPDREGVRRKVEGGRGKAE